MEFKIFLEPIKKNRQQDLDARLAQMQAKKAACAGSKAPASEAAAPAPVAPPKRNSRLVTQSGPSKASENVIKSAPAPGESAELAETVSPPPPARKSYRKIKKT